MIKKKQSNNNFIHIIQAQKVFLEKISKKTKRFNWRPICLTKQPTS